MRPHPRTALSGPQTHHKRSHWARAATATLLPGSGEAWPPSVRKWVSPRLTRDPPVLSGQRCRPWCPRHACLANPPQPRWPGARGAPGTRSLGGNRPMAPGEDGGPGPSPLRGTQPGTGEASPRSPRTGSCLHTLIEGRPARLALLQRASPTVDRPLPGVPEDHWAPRVSHVLVPMPVRWLQLPGDVHRRGHWSCRASARALPPPGYRGPAPGDRGPSRPCRRC